MNNNARKRIAVMLIIMNTFAVVASVFLGFGMELIAFGSAMISSAICTFFFFRRILESTPLGKVMIFLSRRPPEPTPKLKFIIFCEIAVVSWFVFRVMQFALFILAIVLFGYRG